MQKLGYLLGLTIGMAINIAVFIGGVYLSVVLLSKLGLI